MKLAKQAIIVSSLMIFALAVFSNLPSASAVLLSPDDNILRTEGDLRNLIRTVLNYFLGFLGLVTVIFIIYAGILYVTSAGNEDNTTKAKNIIKNAAIGLILILLSFALVNFVLGAFTA